LLPEGLRIGKRIESGGYLGYKFTVAESLLLGSARIAINDSLVVWIFSILPISAVGTRSGFRRRDFFNISHRRLHSFISLEATRDERIQTVCSAWQCS
jgi:hypothetical protein